MKFEGLIAILLVLVALGISFSAIAFLAVNVVSIVYDGPNFWNVFWTIFISSGLLGSIVAKKK
jgi:hypothetical protein